MTFEAWIALIRDVAHTGDEQATLRLALELMLLVLPKKGDLTRRWREVTHYAQLLDLDTIAGVMARGGWRRVRQTIITPCSTHQLKLSRERYIAAWANEIPRTDKEGSWWWQVDRGLTPEPNIAWQDLKDHLTLTGGQWSDQVWIDVGARVTHRALVQFLRARLWMPT